MNPTGLFQHLRMTLLRNTLRVLMERAVLRLITILVCSLLIWGTLFALSYFGFRELRVRYNVPLDGSLIELVFGIMFLALTVLLVFSTGIILYSSLFASAESQFLLASPVPAEHIFAYKYQGAVAFSSWAFVLLASPILIAYGLQVGGGAPWFYYLALPLFFLGFVLLPGSLGALLCLVLVNILPRHRKQLLITPAVILGMVALWFTIRWMRSLSGQTFGSRDWFTNLVQSLAIVIGPWTPSHWVGAGLQAAARGELIDTLYFLTLVWSNGLMLYLGVAWLARKIYRRGYNRMASGGDLRRKYGGATLDHAIDRVLFFFDHQTRLLIVKDFRAFRRDPAQWFQITIFLGLSLLYFSNLRQFYGSGLDPRFQNGISLLTLTATAFLMCAFTGRFIFPLLSLEGRKFWILGLLPLSRDRLLWGKFVFSTMALTLAAEVPVLFANWMLDMPGLIIAAHVTTVAVLAFALSGMSVGLGACLPNFRENDPSKIAVGFGGTLNLVAGLLLLVVVVLTIAGPFHYLMTVDPEVIRQARLGWWIWIGPLLGLQIGIWATILPLRAGARNLRKMEF